MRKTHRAIRIAKKIQAESIARPLRQTRLTMHRLDAGTSLLLDRQREFRVVNRQPMAEEQGDSEEWQLAVVGDDFDLSAFAEPVQFAGVGLQHDVVSVGEPREDSAGLFQASSFDQGLWDDEFTVERGIDPVGNRERFVCDAGADRQLDHGTAKLVDMAVHENISPMCMAAEWPTLIPNASRSG